jgi:hypothetical protein
MEALYKLRSTHIGFYFIFQWKKTSLHRFYLIIISDNGDSISYTFLVLDLKNILDNHRVYEKVSYYLKYSLSIFIASELVLATTWKTAKWLIVFVCSKKNVAHLIFSVLFCLLVKESNDSWSFRFFLDQHTIERKRKQKWLKTNILFDFICFASPFAERLTIFSFSFQLVTVLFHAAQSNIWTMSCELIC